MRDNITIIIITYKSEKIIHNFIKKIPSTIKTLIIENSKNYELKKDIEKKYENISVYLKENDGVSSALNYAVDKIETKYFLQISPDLEFNFEDLNIFLDFAETKENKFAALGPRFLEVKEKNHKQINQDLEFQENFNKGDKVFHKKFGHGTILFIEGDIAEVNFKHFSNKKVYIKFLQLIR